MRLIFTSVLVFGLAASANADSIRLRSGQTVQGTYIGGNAREIRVDVNGNIETYDVSRVQSVTFADTIETPPPPRPEPRQESRQEPPIDEGRFQRPRGAGTGLTIPADTTVTIRMIEAVNSQTARLGQTFRASIDEPVVVDGQQVIPRGADVLTKLVDDRQSGKIEGRTVLTLALVSININGQPVDVTSTDVRTASASRGNRTAGMVGGGAALGAIVGALAGGGKAAGIGAASGAALGGGAEVLTNGQQVKIPSETRLTFRLQNPVQL